MPSVKKTIIQRRSASIPTSHNDDGKKSGHLGWARTVVFSLSTSASTQPGIMLQIRSTAWRELVNTMVL